jgi:hypothetical protein
MSEPLHRPGLAPGEYQLGLELRGAGLGPQTPARVRPPSGYDGGKCRFCEQRVLWCTLVDEMGVVKRHPDRRPIKLPLDPLPTPEGNLRLVGKGRAQKIARGEVVLIADRWQSHLDTCPRRRQRRRRR